MAGETQGKWDNGFYTRGVVSGVGLDFLVDCGSTMTILSSKVYNRMDPETTPRLRPWTNSISGVGGTNIPVLGFADMTIAIEGRSFTNKVVVCDVVPDGILGQDFLLNHVTYIDYRKLQLLTTASPIRCWISGEAEMVCPVKVCELKTIPASSSSWIAVTIPQIDRLSNNCLIESRRTLPTGTHLVGCIIHNRDEVQELHIVNTSSDAVTFHPNMVVGTAESIYPESSGGRCATAKVNTSSPCIQQIPTHLKEMWEASIKHLDQGDQEIFAALLVNYQDVFARCSEDLGRSNRVEHRINTGDANPIRQPPRRQPLGKREIEKNEVNKMLHRGVIEPSNSAWASPVVLIQKKDNSTRFCIDFRRLNDVTKKDAYPLPRTDECLDALSESKWFSTMDLNSGFWQIGVAEEDKEKTAFATSMGLYQFSVMPFGLANAPSTFERLMEDVLRGLQWQDCLLYMDDIIVPGTTVKESLQRLEKIFQRLLDANLKLKPSKCIFFQKSVKFLGHIVSEHGVQTDPEKIIKVQEWPIPRNVKQVRSFMGLCSYYRKFVKGFANIARPLHQLVEKQTRFIWTPECQEAFQTLKTAMTSAPILAYPDTESRFILDTDASGNAVGAVLSQIKDGSEHVIAYMSKALNKYERSYCVTRKELLAVVAALKHFHIYLYGRGILLRTDNAAVSWMRNLKKPTGQVARWLEELGTYNLEVVHRAGRKHSNADALSRYPCKACKRQEENQDSLDDEEEDPASSQVLQDSDPCVGPTNQGSKEKHDVRVITRSQVDPSPSQGPLVSLEGWSLEEIHQKQVGDGQVGPILIALIEDEKPKWSDISHLSSTSKTLWRHWDRLHLNNGVLYRRWVSENGSTHQLVVPEELKKDILLLYHDIPSGGHLGSEKTLERIKTSFYWPGMKNEVEKYCTTCDKCTARKQSRSPQKCPMSSYLVGEPMEKVALDILGPLPLTQLGNRYVLVIMDCFSKWTEAVALPDQEAATVAKAFVDNFVCRFGTPLQVHTDQGSNFESQLFQDLCSWLQIHKTRTSGMRPQSNGGVERFNRTLEVMLTMYCENDQRTWDIYLPQVLMAYRSSVHAATGKTPNMMVFGRDVVLPMQAVIGRPEKDDPDVDVDEYVCTLQDRLEQAHRHARESLKKTSDYQKRHYDLRSREKTLKAGQAVWVHHPRRRVGVCQKLTSSWKGPYLILKKLDDVTYLVKRSMKQPAKVFHADRLLLYKGRNLPMWIVRQVKKLASQ